jgi:excisionase family DNA binding protein
MQKTNFSELECLWTVDDVCNKFNLKAGTVRYWCHVHAITFHKLGTLVRFKPSEVISDFNSGKLGKVGSCRKKKK